MSAPWQWVSFAGEEGFRGVAVVRARDVLDATLVTTMLGINPGGEVLAIEVPTVFGDPPAEWDHKLIADKARINELTEQWHGCSAMRLGDLEDKEEP